MIERLAALAGRDVSRETFERLQRYAAMLVRANEHQNLISADSVAALWGRHLLDGAQLLSLANRSGRWADIGSGAGLPGLVIAILSGERMTLIEPRRLRAEFLRSVVQNLGLIDVDVTAAKASKATGSFDLITARAVGKIDQLFTMTHHLSSPGTRWILPKGESAKSELDDARRNWQGSFQLVPSQTHPAAAIVVADGVRPKR
ncbi:MAG: 16S rRNA (guanine(527)-N(7))-methyltransferase RsmG [Sphingomonas sp.]|uniref:16S rRNA (guanine(527)-N(7))-methyltransferase RsmG n=1 Tax=Sphingomonas sp. TaxID=28214 RepID=UPI00179C9A2E|nr:16S rRNA (guanine(527)-N(7))-methyltransferase RsmG [Sphingomonas sp.]MBA3667368.1 16S rRNA (guanine(527)-N(7))-methyltransferase RsmG [Sphingomonas sp.]